MLFNSFVTLCMKITKSVGLYDGFLTAFSISSRHLKKRKFLCYTNEGTLPSDNTAQDEIFVEICVEMTPQKLLPKFEKCAAWYKVSILDSVKSTGAAWVAARKTIFFRNPVTTQTARACLWVQLQASFLEKTEERQYDILVAFWSSAWKRFLFEEETFLSERKPDFNIVARDSLQAALETRIRHNPEPFREYAPYVYPWIRVRSEVLPKIEILDKCDARYQKSRADYLAVSVLHQMFFVDPNQMPAWVGYYCRKNVVGAQEFTLLHILDDDTFLKKCFNLEPKYKVHKEARDMMSTVLQIIPEGAFIRACFQIENAEKEFVDLDFLDHTEPEEENSEDEYKNSENEGNDKDESETDYEYSSSDDESSEDESETEYEYSSSDSDDWQDEEDLEWEID
uniref:Uncharacterized protein n=1 Tax=Lobelia inflata TaxID=308559 RepID=A0A1L6BTD1_9ASTR|nr:hypothetical protein Lo_inf1Pt0331 [Lobelia inflata]APQ39266.1 hypothetical protein Lo_inf1Pt0331 [Lobelia inflata]